MPEAESDTEMIQDIITKVRNIRAEYECGFQTNGDRTRCDIRRKPIVALLKAGGDYIHKLASGRVEVELWSSLSGDKLSAQAVAAGCAIEVPLAGVIDLAAEMARLTKLRAKALRNDRSIVEKQLSNPDVVARAPAEVVEEKKRQLAELQDQIRKLTAGIDRSIEMIRHRSRIGSAMMLQAALAGRHRDRRYHFRCDHSGQRNRNGSLYHQAASRCCRTSCRCRTGSHGRFEFEIQVLCRQTAITWRPERLLPKCMGSARSILAAERVTLNLLQRMCGIATHDAAVRGPCARNEGQRHRYT